MQTATNKAMVDQALWTVRPAFGNAGGPDVVVLTDAGSLRAFSVGAQVRQSVCPALEYLASIGGRGKLSERVPGTNRIRPTQLLGFFTVEVLNVLRALGYVERTYGDPHTATEDGLFLTDAGKAAVAAGQAERGRLIERIKREREAASAPR